MNSLRRDLFERRLWPVVIVLLIAIIAVPFLFSRSGDTTSAVPPAPKPAVVAGLLSASSRTPVPVSVRISRNAVLRDPFASSVPHLTQTPPQQLAKTAASSSAPAAGAGAAAAPSATPAAKTNLAASIPPASVAPATVTMTTTVMRTVTTPRVTTTTTTASSAVPSSWTIYHVSVSDGTPGGPAVVRPDLPRLTPLPSPTAPKAMFDGVVVGGKDAIFQLAAGVQATGPGLCRPDHTVCSAIVLPAGGVETLQFAGLNGQPDSLDLSVRHIRATVTHSRTKMLAAAARKSAAGACELELADPVRWDATKLIASAKVSGLCLLATMLVPFPGIVAN